MVEEGRKDAKARRGRELTQPSCEEERIATAVVHAAYLVHKALGPGLLERIYEACLCHELSKAGFECKRQVPVPILYDGLCFDEGFRLDVLVEDRIVCELKAVDKPHPVHEAQLLSHLKLTCRNLGLLINFNVPLVRDGIKRIVSNILKTPSRLCAFAALYQSRMGHRARAQRAGLIGRALPSTRTQAST